jgi:hypothetical protein
VALQRARLRASPLVGCAARHRRRDDAFKRSDDVSLARLRAAGTDPQRIVAWVARSLGIDVPARVRAEELVPQFDMTRLPRCEVRVTASDLADLGLPQTSGKPH